MGCLVIIVLVEGLRMAEIGESEFKEALGLEEVH
jgi:hypothetical protein